MRHVKDREKIVKDGKRKKRSMKAHKEENEETSNKRKPAQNKKIYTKRKKKKTDSYWVEVCIIYKSSKGPTSAILPVRFASQK